jgi:hypothetical protein
MLFRWECCLRRERYPGYLLGHILIQAAIVRCDSTEISEIPSEKIYTVEM